MLTGHYAQARHELRISGKNTTESIADARSATDTDDDLPQNANEESAFQLFAAASREDNDDEVHSDDALRRCWRTLGGIDEAKARGFLLRAGVGASEANRIINGQVRAFEQTCSHHGAPLRSAASARLRISIPGEESQPLTRHSSLAPAGHPTSLEGHLSSELREIYECARVYSVVTASHPNTSELPPSVPHSWAWSVNDQRTSPLQALSAHYSAALGGPVDARDVQCAQYTLVVADSGDGDGIAAISYSLCTASAQILYVATNPAYRRNGFAAALLGHVRRHEAAAHAHDPAAARVFLFCNGCRPGEPAGGNATAYWQGRGFVATDLRQLRALGWLDASSTALTIQAPGQLMAIGMPPEEARRRGADADASAEPDASRGNRSSGGQRSAFADSETRGVEEDAFQLFAAATRADSDNASLTDVELRRCWRTLGGVDEEQARRFLRRAGAGASEAKRIIDGHIRAYALTYSHPGTIEAALSATQQQQQRERPAAAAALPRNNSAVVWLKAHGGLWWGKNRDGAEFDDYLSDAWVEENFEAWFRDFVRASGGQWRKIPEGKPPTQPSAGLDATDATTVAWATPETVASLAFGEVLPSVEFQQGDAATCLTCAGANGLFAVGDADGAARVAAAAARTGEQRLTNIKQLGQYIYSSVVGWSPQNPVNFYPGAASDRHCRGLMAHLLAHPSELPTVVTLCDSEGAEDHDVAMVGALIFDSNKPRALPLSQESLDRCVDIERTGLTCTAIARAVRLVPTKKMRRALGLRPAAKEARVAAREQLS